MKIYAPTCHGQCLPAVEKLINRVNSLFGGSTVYDAEGTWVSGDKVEREPIKVIEVGHHCTTPDVAKQFAEAITEYAKEAKQEAIAIHQTDFYLANTADMIEAFKKIKEKIP
jgi:hypothetical protein